MCKKNVWLFYSLNLKKEEKIDFERKVRSEVLCNKDEVCLEICQTNGLNSIQSGLKSLIKKRTPHVIVFHECDDKTIQSHTNAIKKLNKKEFQVLFLEKPNSKNSTELGFKIEGLKHVPMFLTTVSI